MLYTYNKALYNIIVNLLISNIYSDAGIVAVKSKKYGKIELFETVLTTQDTLYYVYHVYFMGYDVEIIRDNNAGMLTIMDIYKKSFDGCIDLKIVLENALKDAGHDWTVKVISLTE